MSGETSRRRRFNPDRDVKEWKGAYVPYDILKEAFVALLAVAVLITLLAVVFSSPDEPAITLKTWSAVDPVDFAQTAVTELDGSSATATYGPPYNATPDSSQHIGLLRAQSVARRAPAHRHGAGFRPRPAADPAQPTATQRRDHHLQTRLPAQQGAWTTAYEKAVANATDVERPLHVPVGRYGPVGRHHRFVDRHGADGWSRWHPPERRPVLQHQLHQAAAVPGRRHLPREPGRHQHLRETSGA